MSASDVGAALIMYQNSYTWKIHVVYDFNFLGRDPCSLVGDNSV
jgi:hypothetical protein